MKSIKKIIYTNQIFENEIEKIEIVGFDRLWNICKLVINLVINNQYNRVTNQIFEYIPVRNLASVKLYSFLSIN